MKTFLRPYTALVLLFFSIFLSFKGLAQQVQKGLTAANGQYIGFLQFTPPDYTDGLKHPLIIFLHGIGERGDGTTQLSMVANNPIPAMLTGSATMKFSYKGVTASFCVLSPQLSTSYGNWQDFYVDEMLKYAKQNLNIDTTRIYLAGLSLGGGGVWHYASSSLSHAQTFAAIAPVCGVYQLVDPANICNAMLPVWAFHAVDDGVVSWTNTINQVQSINYCKPGLALQTIYGSGNHYIWGRVFDSTHKTWDTYPTGTITQNPNIFEWFLQFKRMPPGTPLAPIARAGHDTVLTLPVTSTTLNGSLSYDPDGTIVSYSWSYISGPSQYIIATPTTATTAISNLVQGVYKFRLTVTDNSGMTAYDDIAVTVKPPGNMPPISNAGPDITITLPTNTATLDGSASYDPDGSINQYQWTQLSGPATATIGNPAAAVTTISNLVQGTYKFSLRVWDNTWTPNVTDAIVTVTVNPPSTNQPPVANAGTNTTITLPTNSATLNGTGSYDPDGTIVSYSWAWVGGPSQYTIANPSAASTTVSNLLQGTYTFKLTVTDNGGASTSATVQVIVNPAPNQPPVANAGTNTTITLPTNSATLNGTGSYDPDGTIVSYSWTWVSGPSQYTIANAAAASTTVSNLAQGTYTFKLTVTDNGGASTSATVQVTVNKAPNQLPVATTDSMFNITLPVNAVTLDGSRSMDPDGTITAYSWSWVSGPSQYTIANPTSAITAVSNLVQGTYHFRLQVTDNDGGVGTANVTIIVNPKPNLPPVARAGNDQFVSASQTVILDGSASYDPDGIIRSYNWSLVSGAGGAITIVNASTPVASVIGLRTGVYIFELTVTDDNGATDKARVKITVNASSQAANPQGGPIAVAGPDSTIAIPQNYILLDGSRSYEIGGSIKTYVWKQLSGPSYSVIENAASVQTLTNSLVEGIYVFELTVTDEQGAVGKDTIRITVVNMLRSEEKLTLYPNPATDILNIRCMTDMAGTVKLTIINANGQIVKVFASNKIQSYFNMFISVNELKAGPYYLEVNIDNKKRMLSKFIKL